MGHRSGASAISDRQRWTAAMNVPSPAPDQRPSYHCAASSISCSAPASSLMTATATPQLFADPSDGFVRGDGLGGAVQDPLQPLEDDLFPLLVALDQAR